MNHDHLQAGIEVRISPMQLQVATFGNYSLVKSKLLVATYNIKHCQLGNAYKLAG